MNELQIIEFNNQRILTTEQLAEFYDVSEKQIRQNFNNNKIKFIEGKHYFRLEGSELKKFKDSVENFDIVGNRVNQLILYTKQGASRHSKMLGTDQAWDMFDELEENYFNPRYQPMSIEQMMIHQLQEMETVKQDVSQLKIEMEVSSSQRRRIQGAVNTTVLKVLGGKKSNAYKDTPIRRKSFSDCYKQLKQYYDVASYMDIPRVRFEEALVLIPKWQPPLELQARIDGANGSNGIFAE
ncbi:ORF6C domain-containing protein [Enterococcus sp. LJL90]